jgi:hypothetical protein
MEKENKRQTPTDLELNKQRQGVDKAPGEEQNKGEKVTNEDLKGKKVDADPQRESDKPSR